MQKRPMPMTRSGTRPIPDGVTKPSTRPAMTSQADAPATSSRATRASVATDAERRFAPGLTKAIATRNPAVPAIVTHESSSNPCGTTSCTKIDVAPAPPARPAKTPIVRAFVISTYAVTTPPVRPPANANSATKMLWVKMVDAKTDCCGTGIPRFAPWARCAVTAAITPGTNRDAWPGSTSAQSVASIAGTINKTLASRSGNGCSRMRTQNLRVKK